MLNVHFANHIKFFVVVNVLNVKTMDSNFMNIAASVDCLKVLPKHAAL
jgi:hypothetical protein